MLTNSIYRHRSTAQGTNIGQPTPRLNKMEYASFLLHMGIKKGDILLGVYTDGEHLSKYGFFKVKDIQEIHYMCEYEVVDGKPLPRCLQLCNCMGSEFWASPARWMVAPEELLQRKQIREAFDAYTSHQQTPYKEYIGY